jgi:large subunit ribosomal protein L18e
LIENIRLNETVKALKAAGRKGKAPIWTRAAELLEHSRSRRVEVNLARLRGAGAEGGLILVPGKVLGDGDAPSKITIGAYAFSREARRKIEKANSKAVPILEFQGKHKDGKGVLLIGG